MADSVEALRPGLLGLRAALPETPILVGGRAFGDPVRAPGVDGVEVAPAPLGAALERIAHICRRAERARTTEGSK